MCPHSAGVPISLLALGGTKQISALDLEFSFYDTFRLIGSTLKSLLFGWNWFHVTARISMTLFHKFWNLIFRFNKLHSKSISIKTYTYFEPIEVHNCICVMWTLRSIFSNRADRKRVQSNVEAIKCQQIK